ncbi:MAG TPA: L,D-transpeptidase, partial [Coriobacteriia bacterium]|nr:L,D-transpeptidase [Coriobacteriia bacterium]
VKKGTAALAKVFSKEQALSEANRAVRVPVKKIKPTVTEKRFEKTLLVDLSERRIRLFVNGELEKTYPCAVGTPGYPTPTGKYEIVLKRYLPTWVNPGSDWGKDMPASIPPGPGNPLGTRALNIDAPGIRFHGTENIASVGTAASHGCMRMYRSDIEDLYERVDVGNKVFIVP